jgi:hypothetical protein
VNEAAWVRGHRAEGRYSGVGCALSVAIATAPERLVESAGAELSDHSPGIKMTANYGARP